MDENSENEVTSSNEPTEAEVAVRKEAESQGWVPKERYRGDESDWIDADVFVKRGREILPILRKNNENLVRDLNNTKEQLKQFQQTAKEFKEFQQESYDRKVKDYEQEIKQLKESRAQAISDGDGQRVNALDDQIDEAKDAIRDTKDASKNSATTDIDPPSSVDPSLQSWLDKNEWFGKEKRLTQMTNAIGETLRVEFPMLKGDAFLEKLDEALLEEFPDRFGSKAKKKAPAGMVESGSGRQGRPSSKAESYENLPAEAKAACNRFVKQGLMTRETYLADYDWS